MRISNRITSATSRAGYIKAEDGLYNEMRFTYRPVPVRNRQALLEQLKQPQDVYVDLCCALLAEHVTEWDIDEGGNKVPINKQTVSEIVPELWWKLYRIVMGTVASDKDPNWTAEISDKMDRARIEASITGRTVESVLAEETGKN